MAAGADAFGVAPFGADLPPWRAIVEAGANITAAGDPVGVGNPIAQGQSAVTADGAAGTHAVAVVQTVADITADAQAQGPGVVLIEARASIDAQANAEGPGVVVIEARSSITAQDTPVMLASPIATSAPAITAAGDADARANAIGTSAPALTASADIATSAIASEQPPVATIAAPDLLPLRVSHEADDLETELKALFIELFNTYIRPDERYINVLGMPQHGPRALVDQSLAADGLSIYRGADVASGAGAYLLRAWRALNPKRGMHLLETYLQLLWPNVWTADQMWQVAASAYPTALHTTEAAGRFLTSRVEVTLPARVTTGGDVNAISSGLRASLPARMVMNMTIVEESTFGVGIASVYYAGAAVASYEGTFQ